MLLPICKILRHVAYKNTCLELSLLYVRDQIRHPFFDPFERDVEEPYSWLSLLEFNYRNFMKSLINAF
jgi:hypothetical protein